MTTEKWLWIAAIVITNVANWINNYVSHMIKIGKLEVRVEDCEHDIDEAWVAIRTVKSDQQITTKQSKD